MGNTQLTKALEASRDFTLTVFKFSFDFKLSDHIEAKKRSPLETNYLLCNFEAWSLSSLDEYHRT